MSDDPQRVKLWTDDIEPLMVDKHGRILVVCPCCKAEGKTNTQAFPWPEPIEWELRP